MVTSNTKDPINTIVILALFCCGKTTLAKTSTKYSIIDLDAEVEPRTNRIPIKDRLPLNQVYEKRIKECIGEYDFILLPVKQMIFSILHSNNIPYILVYPDNTPECRKEWERRNLQRNTGWLWKANRSYWQTLMGTFHRDRKAKSKYILNKDQYLSDIIDKIYEENKVQ